MRPIGLIGALFATAMARGRLAAGPVVITGTMTPDAPPTPTPQRVIVPRLKPAYARWDTSHPPTNGVRECARRRRQIYAGAHRPPVVLLPWLRAS